MREQADGAPAPTQAPLVLSPVDAAAMLALSPATLDYMRKRGTGPEFVSLGVRKIGYTPEALAAFVASRQRHRSTSDGRPAAPARKYRPHKPRGGARS